MLQESITSVSCSTQKKNLYQEKNIFGIIFSFFEPNNIFTMTTIKLAINEENVIERDSNPTTGARWTFVIEDESIVSIPTNEYIRPQSGMMGQSGKQKLVLKGLKAGQTTITLNYGRSFETTPWNTETLTIIVE
ncbi:inhibitor of cysteine peptidase [Anaeramoeba flamelloides]|uniref:Inhibitor of cysteine peptidase n=1 Tax=Anaeramoeba flamelloides TaxID=1746091 RepID=A0AAV7YDU6_9EUKA|nr:inhibitor of cysteine peptidase [Anaeramoeba flamelloides]